MTPQIVDTNAIEPDLRALLMRKGLVGGQFVIGNDHGKIVAARDRQSNDVKLSDGEAERLWLAARYTLSAAPAVGDVFHLPLFDMGQGGPKVMLSREDRDHIQANKPKREDFRGDEPAFIRALIAWQKSHGLDARGQPV